MCKLVCFIKMQERINPRKEWLKTTVAENYEEMQIFYDTMRFIKEVKNFYRLL